MEKMAQNVSRGLMSKNKDFNSQDVMLIVSSVLNDRKNSNEIIDLLEGLLSQNENDVIFSVDCLQRIFTGLISTGEILQKDASPLEQLADNEPAEKYKIWLLDQYNETKKQFLVLLNHPKSSVQQSSAEALFSFLQTENEKLSSGGFSTGFIKQVISHLLNSERDMRNAIKAVIDCDIDNTLKLRILMVIRTSLKTSLTKDVKENYLLNVYEFLKVNWIPKKAKDHDSNTDIQKLKALYSESWVEFLKFQIPFHIYKRTLVDLYEKVLPNMKNPLVLTDFLTDSYNFGGAVSLLALNGLFFLIQKCNLEYPNFFEKLYILLSDDVFHAKYRPQFFYLMDLFLSSLHVPAYMIAAFIKKLARLSLVAPPDALLIIIPFLKNLLVRHPSARVLINRVDAIEVSNDPFLPDEMCMSKCKAIESSLWEIKTLQMHWHPLVSKEATFINKPLPSMETDMADVLDTDFSQLYSQEVETKLHKVPLSYDVPKGLFNRTEDKMSFWSMN